MHRKSATMRDKRQKGTDKIGKKSYVLAQKNKQKEYPTLEDTLEQRQAEGQIETARRKDTGNDSRAGTVWTACPAVNTRRAVLRARHKAILLLSKTSR